LLRGIENRSVAALPLWRPAARVTVRLHARLATAQIIAKKLDYKVTDFEVEERLYAAAPEGLLEVIPGREADAQPAE
jgi:hypothetical protein